MGLIEKTSENAKMKQSGEHGSTLYGSRTFHNTNPPEVIIKGPIINLSTNKKIEHSCRTLNKGKSK